MPATQLEPQAIPARMGPAGSNSGPGSRISEWKSLRVWAFGDAATRLGELLDAAIVSPQIVERDGRRFVISLAADASKKDVGFLLRGGPLEGDEDLGS